MKLANKNSAGPFCCDNNGGRLEKLIELYHGLKSSTISYYELFGLGKAATADEIRTAFLDFSVAFHPDHIFSLALAEIRDMAYFVFDAANHAFEELIEEDSRKEYDEDDVQLISANFRKQNKNR